MTTGESSLSAFQTVFDEIFENVRAAGSGPDSLALVIAGEAFGRAPVGPQVPTQSIRTMITVLGEICSSTAEGAYEADTFLPLGIMVKSSKAYLIGIRFLTLFLKEFRSIICSDAKLKDIEKAVRIDPKTTITLIVSQLPAAWLGMTAGTSALAVSLVTAIIIQSGRSAFCKTTEDELLDSIIHAASFEEPDGKE